MLKKVLLFLVSSFLLLAPAAAQDNDNPTIAVLRFGTNPGVSLTEIGLLDILELYDLITAEERAALDEQQDLKGERINVIWGDANFDFANASLIVDGALDQDADVLLTLSTPVTQAAVNATLDLDDPPAVLFTLVYNPYRSGIADAPCIKPDHVTGLETLTPYDEIVPLLMVQDPDMEMIGTIYSLGEVSGVFGAERITEAAEALGLTVEAAGITAISDLPLAAESLIDRGVEAFLIPTDMITGQGLPLLMRIAIENNIPIFHSALGGIYSGATIGAGSGLHYIRGMNIGHILAAYLDGSLDIAKTAITIISNMGVAVNMDLATMQNAEISEELMSKANFVIEGRQVQIPNLEYLDEYLSGATASHALQGVVKLLTRNPIPIELAPEVLAYVESMEDPDYKASGAAFLETLACTPEQIAAQQAELDAQGE